MGKTGWKRLLSAFLCVCMVAVMAPTAFAGEETTFDLTAAIQNATDVSTITVPSGTYTMPASDNAYTGKALTIKAAANADVTFDMSEAKAIHNAVITFENVTFDYKTNKDYIGLQHASKLTYNNCKIKGKVFLYATEETFHNCAFTQTAVDYNVWTYGAATVNFDHCTFDCAGKSVLLYNEGTNTATALTVTGCTFTASAEAEGKAAIEIDTSLMTGTSTVTIDSATTAAGFANGSKSGNPLWNDKKVTNNNVVTVAGKKVWANGTFVTDVAEVNGVKYTSLAAAVAAAKDGDTVKLLKNASTSTLKSGVTYDLNGQTLTYTSGMTVTNTVAPTSFIDTSVSGAARGGTLKMTRTARGGAAFTVSAGTTFNAQNICIESTRCEGIFPQGKDATLNITNCDMKANWYCVGTNAGSLANYGVIINLKGSTFSSMGTYAVDGTAIYINVSGELNIDDCVLTAPRQALMVRAGTANITNSTLKTTGSYSDKEQYYTGKWGSGNEVPAAALVVGNYVNGAADAYVADAVVTVENTKLIGENDFPALYVDGNTAYKGDVSISGDKTTVSGAVMKGQNQDNAVISISGGLFNTQFDRSYCTTGLTVVNNNDEATKSTYPYIVGTLPANTENKIDAATDIGDNTVNVDAITNSEDKNAAQDAAEKVKFEEAVADKNEITETDKQRGLTALANENKVQVDSDGKIQGNTTVTIVKEVFFDITVTDFKVRGLADKDVSVTMDITPKYNLIATTDKDNRTDANSVTLETKPLTVSEATKVSVTIPAFANKKVYIDHANGKNLYVATADAYGKIEFTTNGFSPFTFTLSNPNVVAEVNGNAYTSFQDAVNAVANGGTIDIVGGTSYTATINSGDSKTFTVKNTLGSDITVKVNNDSKTVGKDNGTQSFTYTKPSTSSSGSSSGKTTYKVTTSAVNNGGVNASPSSAEKGAAITITLSPDKGYKLDKMTVTDGSGKTISTTRKSDTVYTFTMPASAVKVSVSYVKDDSAVVEPTTGFSDVAATAWYAKAVKYAVDKGMMNGVGGNKFAPDGVTNRGMIVTVLYRLENEPTASAVSFTDVESGAYYANAVAWASANGIVTGYGNGKFGPNDSITREQFAAILYRYAQYKKYDVSVGEDTNILSYNDAQSISSYAIPAIQWACGAGVMNGSNGRLTPKLGATRAQAAQLLMNFCENAAK